MTAAIQAAIPAGGTVYSVTIGTVGPTFTLYGYNPGQWGDISQTDHRGFTIKNLQSNTSGSQKYDLNLTLQGDGLSQSSIAGVLVQTTAGSYRWLPSNSATFSVFGSPTLNQWNWDTDTPVWTATTPSPRTMIII